jgi:predicted GIY-YIG superfamily endonuclease
VRSSELKAKGGEELQYSVYVIELDDSKRRGSQREALYVGQTVRSPEERLAQHQNHERSSRHVRGHVVRLRPDLYVQYNPLPTRAAAEAKEEWLAERLRAEGYDVYSN